MKCAVYIRVSTDKEEQKTSLANQQQFFYNFIAEQGWELFKFYVDVESGTKSQKRKNLIELIEDAKDRKFDIILSKELSRLARNGKLSYEIKEIAERNHIHILTFDGAIDSLKGNIHMFGLYAWLYEQESQRTSERIKASLRTQARRGEFIGSIPPFGYKLANKQLIVRDDNTPDIVRQIFQMYLTGKGFDGIARYLTTKGYPTPAKVAGKSNSGKFWHGSTVKKILTNPHYCGDLVQGRERTKSVTLTAREVVPEENQIIVRGTHEPIISREDFETVQRLVKSNQKQYKKVKKHLFTNLLYCSDCQTGMWYKQNRSGYICGRYAKHGKKFCSQRTVKEAHLKQLIANDIKDIETLLKNEVRLEQLKKVHSKEKAAIQGEITVIDKRVEEIHQKKKRFLELLAGNVITEQEYRNAVDEYKAELVELNTKRSELEKSLHSDSFSHEVDSLKKLLSRFGPKYQIKEELLHHLVERIDIDKDGTPHITYRFSLMND